MFFMGIQSFQKSNGFKFYEEPYVNTNKKDNSTILTLNDDKKHPIYQTCQKYWMLQ